MKNMNKAVVSLRGVFPPIPTSFDGEGNVAHQALVENLERWNQYGLSGYVVLGSNGEAVYLDQDEKVGVWEAARQVIPQDRVMIAGTGCESTRRTIEVTRLAAGTGVDAALVVTPHYYGSQMVSDSLLHHYQAVADASPVPIIVYNVPKFTGVNVDAGTLARLSQHANIIGVKDTSGNIAQLADTVRLASPDFQVLAGSASFLLAGLAVGAVGGILALANIAPVQSIGIYRLFEEGRWDDAAQLQRRMLPVNAAVTADYGIAGLKAALDMLGYHGGPVRSPLLDLDENRRQALRAVLAEGGIL
jgi:4-hydroxy-2-oxoglutarate aldolase